MKKIRIFGARQNNLAGLDVEIPSGKLTVVTGVSGSGKSSLVFDTVFAEGQRRYIETFSPYARQFLDRLPPPRVDRVEGIPPAIAIRQTNSVRNHRSTVGTMTELQDCFKVLFSTCARLICPECGQEIRPATPDSVFDALLARKDLRGKRLYIAFPVSCSEKLTREEILQMLSAQGFSRVSEETPAVGEAQAGTRLRVLLDNVVLTEEKRPRIVESLEKAFSLGHGELRVIPLAEDRSELPALFFTARFACPRCRISFSEPSPNLFSFNSPIGACPQCKGFGRTICVSEKLVIPDPRLPLAVCIKPFQTSTNLPLNDFLLKETARRRGKRWLQTAWADLPEDLKKWVWEGDADFSDEMDGDEYRMHGWMGIARFFEWLESRSYKMHIRVLLSRYREYQLCPSCRGARLKPEALYWKLMLPEEARAAHPEFSAALTVPEFSALPCSTLFRFLTVYRDCIAAEKTPAADAARAVLAQILPRLHYLEEVGVGYLSPDRPARTLSGGETQRIALTTALGTDLTGTLFVLDEPSVGLHPRDISRLVAILKKLCAAGNTLLVVEHDPAVILAADHVIELGPGPGSAGGRVVFKGSVERLLQSKKSLSAPWLKAEQTAAASGSGAVQPLRTLEAEDPSGKWKEPPALQLLGAREHNLKNLTVSFPQQKLTVITGVSGSGKSTLMNDILYPAMRRALGLANTDRETGAFDRLVNAEAFSSVLLLDQTSLSKNSRATPASFIGAFDVVRKLFAESPEAVSSGFRASDFSFNSSIGRCPVCEGTGCEHIEMQFLSDVFLPCEACGGKRFRPDLLAVKISDPREPSRNFSIADFLELSIDEAAAFLDALPEAKHISSKPLLPLQEAGLGYLKMGQSLSTLSGGEAQRLKLAEFLSQLYRDETVAEKKSKKAAKEPQKPALLLFDEPTTGLHFSDIEKLLAVFEKLLLRGHTLIVIEHNLQVVRAANCILELGPGGGEDGGNLVRKINIKPERKSPEGAKTWMS